ncbi:hypothetical protein ABZ917_21795 [Nonomuraea wenchangensis]
MEEPMGIDTVTSRDAVMVLPGIMGSELVEVETGRTLWGLANGAWYARAWTSGSSLRALQVTDEERSGTTGRIAARRLLRVPAFAPVLRGVEPYTALLMAAQRQASDPMAVREFAYDWRLSIEHNARLLAVHAERHLNMWRGHPKGSRSAQLVLVAHSMGGLVASYFMYVLGGATDVRALVTLGTPFYGAVKAVHLMSTGAGAPLPMPRQRLRALALTLPGLHDLLPTYRCVDEGHTARRLTAADIAAVGGNPALSQEAFDRRKRLMAGAATAGWAQLSPLVGVQQNTMQSLVLNDGVAEPHGYTCLPRADGGMERLDMRGDGTVYRQSASPAGTQPFHLPQTHGALAARPEPIAHVCAVMTQRTLGPWLPKRVEIALDVPEIVNISHDLRIIVQGELNPAAVQCRVVDVDSGRPVAHPRLTRHDDHLAAASRLPRPGLYRVEAAAGGMSPVSELVLAIGPDPDAISGAARG